MYKYHSIKDKNALSIILNEHEQINCIYSWQYLFICLSRWSMKCLTSNHYYWYNRRDCHDPSDYLCINWVFVIIIFRRFICHKRNQKQTLQIKHWLRLSYLFSIQITLYTNLIIIRDFVDKIFFRMWYNSIYEFTITFVIVFG